MENRGNCDSGARMLSCDTPQRLLSKVDARKHQANYLTLTGLIDKIAKKVFNRCYKIASGGEVACAET